jgi:hypothetical protein
MKRYFLPPTKEAQTKQVLCWKCSYRTNHKATLTTRGELAWVCDNCKGEGFLRWSNMNETVAF